MTKAKSPVQLTVDQVHLITRALADGRRYDILRHIGGCEATSSCTAMREAVGVSAATLSHHMKELETAGLVRSTRSGKFVSYVRRPEILRAYLKQLKADLA